MVLSSDRFPPPPRTDDSIFQTAAGKVVQKLSKPGVFSSPGSNCSLEPETVTVSREVGLGGSGRSGWRRGRSRVHCRVEGPGECPYPSVWGLGLYASWSRSGEKDWAESGKTCCSLWRWVDSVILSCSEESKSVETPAGPTAMWLSRPYTPRSRQIGWHSTWAVRACGSTLRSLNTLRSCGRWGPE